jgi:lipoprotein-releasing system permease protein
MFNPAESGFEKIKSMSDVVNYAEVIEEVALLKYRNQVYPAVVKGVPDNYARYTKIDTLIIDGSFLLEDKGISYAVVGQGIAYSLGIQPAFTDHIMIYVPRKGKSVSINPSQAINQNYIFPSGVFTVLEEIDSKYIIVSFNFAEDLFNSGNEVSSIELGINKDANIKKVQKEIQQILGENFEVKNQYQQHDLVYKTMESEKWAAYLILVFILIIASFNLLGSLSMLIIDKSDDIFILRSMGADSETIRKIFLFEGWLISIIGAFLGTLFGVLICWAQIRFEIVTLPGSSFVISAYPVKVIFTDIFLVLGIVLLIGFLAAWYPVRFISQKYLLSRNI